MPVTETAPAFVMVASPDNAAAVKPFPSPIRTCVSATALSEGTPLELASLTFTVLAAISASSALATPPSLIVMSPEDAAKLAELKEATPLLEVDASSPAIVSVVPVAEVSIPSPPVTVRLSESRSTSIVPLSDIRSRSWVVLVSLHML